MLRLNQIRYRYPGFSWALSVDALEVRTGETVAVIGPNGSGKSTLLKLAAGVLRPDEGEVFLGDQVLPELDPREVARRRGYLPQAVSPVFDYSVEAVVRMGRYPHLDHFGGSSEADEAVVDECLERTGMIELRRRPLSHLSGGEQKRALLASVLAQEPALLLLDEPTAALDLHHQVRLHRLLKDLAERGIGVVAVTHDINLAALFFDRLVLLREGRILAVGDPREVLTSERLADLYGEAVMVQTHPECGRPVVLPRVGS